MIKSIEAIYAEGTLRPLEALNLREQQHVRLIVQPIEQEPGQDPQMALKRLLGRLEQSSFHSAGPYPTRDQLHERQ